MNDLTVHDATLSFHSIRILQFLELMAVIVALFLVLAGPAIIFRTQLRILQQKELHQLEEKLNAEVDGTLSENQDLLRLRMGRSVARVLDGIKKSIVRKLSMTWL